MNEKMSYGWKKSVGLNRAEQDFPGLQSGLFEQMDDKQQQQN